MLLIYSFACYRRDFNKTMTDLTKSRLRVRALEDEVEKPMNVHRWRTLEVRSQGHFHYTTTHRWDCWFYSATI